MIVKEPPCYVDLTGKSISQTTTEMSTANLHSGDHCTCFMYEYRIQTYWIASKHVIFAGGKFREKGICNILARRYFRECTVHAKISSRENIFPRKYLPRFFSVPQICRLLRLGYAVFGNLCLIRLWITNWCRLSYLLRNQM